MSSFTAADYPVLEPGIYSATFLRTEELAEEGTFGPYIDWYFAVETEDGTVDVSGRSSKPARLTRATKARQWVEEILGRALAKGENIDTRSLEGTRVRLTVGLNDTGQFNRVIDIHRDAEAHPAKADDLPF